MLYSARRVLTTGPGEKIVPLPQESAVSASPLITGAVMFGARRAAPGMLVEPRSPPENDAAFRDAIWCAACISPCREPGC